MIRASAGALGLPESLLDYPADTTRAIASLHYSNTFARTPDVRYVLAHAGGTVPYLAGRFGIIDEMNIIRGAEARASAAETFRRLYWDTALSWGDPVLRMLRDVVGLDRVLFGSDYPYLRRDLAVSCREHIEASPELASSDRTAIVGVTATKLIPRLASLRTQFTGIR
ncbi:MAG: amidohydrolase family protein [Streptosporangiaceae bacterium]